MSKLLSLFSSTKRAPLQKGLRRKHFARPARAALGIEQLECRWALSAAPVLSLDEPTPITSNEGASVTVDFKFTDAIEGGGAELGINAALYAGSSNGNFTASANILINTTDGTWNGVNAFSSVLIPRGSTMVRAFVFNNFTLNAGVTITAVGDKPLAILAQGDITINGTIDLRPQSTGMTSGYDNRHLAGAGGGEGGKYVAGTNFYTFEYYAVLTGRAAAGAPADSGGQVGNSGEGGGGGGHGGAGGHGSLPFPAPGGVAYGDLLTTGNIRGGSGGAAGEFVTSINPGGGDGGGGIELSAVGDVTIGALGSVLADGIAGEFTGFEAGGGGGAGGGIFIHGEDVTVNGTLSADGGAGGNVVGGGGGGGGGRILVAELAAGSTAAPTIALAAEATITADGGLFGSGADYGQNGVVITNHTIVGAAVAETYTYQVVWGNGDIDMGTDANITTVIPGSPGVDTLRKFSASTTYADSGVMSVVVRMADSSMTGNFAAVAAAGNYVELTFNVAVANVAPEGLFANGGAVDEGSSGSVGFAGEVDPSTPDTVAGFRYAYDFDNDGTWEIGTGSYAGSSTMSSAAVPATFLADGPASRIVKGRVIDDDGGFTDYTTTITVNNVAPTADAGGPYLTFDDASIMLSGMGTDVPSDVLTYEWDFDGDFNTIEATGANATFDPVALGLVVVGMEDVVVRLRVLDEDGDVSVVDVSTVRVIGEGTQLLDGVLYVVGDVSASDIVLIALCESDIKVFATFNNDNPAVFPENVVNKIYVRTRGGHDVVVTTSNVLKTMTIDGGADNDLLVGGGGENFILGGAGHDTLIGGAVDDVLWGGDDDDDLFGRGGDDVLVGGAGRDILDGGVGRDLLIGGANEDRLHGGTDDDILIGGFTSHDGDLGALDAIMTIWGSEQSFTDRVATLQADWLITSGDPEGFTVFDDDAADHIIGAAGRDLAFGDTSKLDGVKDTISLSSSQDVLVALN